MRYLILKEEFLTIGFAITRTDSLKVQALLSTETAETFLYFPINAIKSIILHNCEQAAISSYNY